MGAQIAATRLTLRGDGPWRGLTTLSKTSPFQFLELENGYVNADASEIRTFPGYICVLNPARNARAWSTTQPFGFIANHYAARRPVLAAAVNSYQIETLAPTEVQYVWTRPTNFHCFEQLNTRWVFIGESDHVREPIFDAGRGFFVKVVSYDDVGGTQVALTLDAAPDTTVNVFNALPNVVDRVYLEGLTGAQASLLNFKGHNVVSVVGAVVTINTNIGSISNQLSQTGYIDRVTNPGVGSGAAPATDDKESLTIWTVLDRGSASIALGNTVTYPAHVANRMRDFGDTVGVTKQGNNAAGTPAGGRSRRRQKPLPYRVVPHQAGNRLVLAVPGYGCVFQVPGVIPPNFDEVTSTLGISALGNDIFDMPRALGVPKGCMWADNDKVAGVGAGSSVHFYAGGTNEFSFGGSNVAVSARNGVYKFCVAYRDEATGEIGRLSEELALTTNTSQDRIGIQLPIYFPGYLMHESLALTVNIYRTAKDGSIFFFDQTATLNAMSENVVSLPVSSKYGLVPLSGVTEYFYHALVKPTYVSDATLQARTATVPTELQQMPMGCKAARTARGFTAFGGALGNAGSRKEMMRGTLSLYYDGNAAPLDGIGAQQNRVGSAFTNDWIGPPYGPSSFEGSETDFGCSAKHIPPAYEGQTVVSRTLFPYPRKAIQLDLMRNTDVGYTGTVTDTSGRIPDVRYTMVESPLRTDRDYTITGSQRQEAFLMLPRSRVQFSEPDNPGVVPATNTAILANEQDFDIEGIGDSGGQFVICTRDRSYSISFSQTPIQVPPDIVSDKFGCISANSMVTFDGGCAWISARGPVVMAEGVQFIGQPLERSFVGEPGRYLRSTDGMLRHSWACHDAERNLLYFGVYAGRAGLTDSDPLSFRVNFRGTNYSWESAGGAVENGVPVADQVRSRFPCDEVLIYSYKADAWSVWRPPLTLGVQWMTRGVDSDGNYRVFFMDQRGAIYLMDDAYGNGSKESNQQTLLQSGALTTLNIVPSTEPTWVGLKVVIYKAATASEPSILRGVTEVASQTTSTITLANAVTAQAGDTVLIGARSMTLNTTFFNIKDSAATRINKIGTRFQMSSRKSLGVAGALTQECFASISVRTEELRDGVPTTYENSLTTEAAASPTSYQWIGRDLANDAVHDATFDRGSLSGPSHQAKMTIVGGAQVRLLDLYAEAQ